MTDDLVRRLRSVLEGQVTTQRLIEIGHVVSEAAARIEALEAENERLRETLDVIAMHPGPNADDACWSRVEDARAALTPKAPHAE